MRPPGSIAGADTPLLTALVGDASRRRDAWRTWTAAGGPLLDRVRADTTDRIRSLLPLAADTAEIAELLDAATLDAVRVAAAREQLRHETLARITRSAVDALGQASIAAIAFDGFLLAEGYWPNPAARHSGGPRLVVAAGAVDSAIATLTAVGWTPVPVDTRFGPGPWPLRHASGVEAVVAERPTDAAVDGAVLDEMWSRTTVHGDGSRPAAADELFALVVHGATYGSGRSMQWVLDAHFVASHRSLDWEALTRTARTHPTARRVAALLASMANDLGTAVPDGVVAAVSKGRRVERRREFAALAAASRATGRWDKVAMVRQAPSVTGAGLRATWIVGEWLTRDR
jgi:hypothetical protein